MKLNITIDNKSYEVEVEVAEDDRGPAPGSMPYYSAAPTSVVSMPPPLPVANGAPGSNGHVEEGKVCRSPIAGIVARINAQAGQQIQVNDPMMVLEAMKMETNITAPVAGKIKVINVAVGDAVQSGTVMVEFE